MMQLGMVCNQHEGEMVLLGLIDCIGVLYYNGVCNVIYDNNPYGDCVNSRA